METKLTTVLIAVSVAAFALTAGLVVGTFISWAIFG